GAEHPRQLDRDGRAPSPLEAGDGQRLAAESGAEAAEEVDVEVEVAGEGGVDLAAGVEGDDLEGDRAIAVGEARAGGPGMGGPGQLEAERAGAFERSQLVEAARRRRREREGQRERRAREEPQSPRPAATRTPRGSGHRAARRS